MMKEMIRKVMEWCKLWNGETATAKQAGPSSDKREKEQAADKPGSTRPFGELLVETL